MQWESAGIQSPFFILTSFCRFQMPSLWVNSFLVVRNFGQMRDSKWLLRAKGYPCSGPHHEQPYTYTYLILQVRGAILPGKHIAVINYNMIHIQLVHWNKSVTQYASTYLILQVPDAVLVGKLIAGGAALWQDAALKAAHVEQQVRVVLAVNWDKTLLPQEGCDGTRETILHVPEHSTSPGHQTTKTSYN